MRKLLKYWNQNKRKILITIAVIALVIIIIQMANAMIRNQNERDRNHNVTKNPTIANDITKPNESVISNDKLTQKETEENSKFIEQFVNNCNEDKIDEAYDLLTEDCKIELYPTKEIFISNYINQIFKQEVNYQLELWYSASNCYTYKITYNKGNLLQTGGQAAGGNFVDYITLIKQKEGYRLNINKFIRKETIDKKGSNSGIEVQVNSKSVYMDYEIYHIVVQNNTQKTVLLNDRTSSRNFSLIGKDGNIFTSVISEITMSNLTLNPQYRKNLDIKFNKIYMTESKAETMQMTEVYLDKEQYDNSQESIDKTTIKIKL